MNSIGYPFNPKYHFHKGGCAADVRDGRTLSFIKNLLIFYHLVTEWIPSFVEFVDIFTPKTRNSRGL